MTSSVRWRTRSHCLTTRLVLHQISKRRPSTHWLLQRLFFVDPCALKEQVRDETISEVIDALVQWRVGPSPGVQSQQSHAHTKPEASTYFSSMGSTGALQQSLSQQHFVKQASMNQQPSYSMTSAASTGAYAAPARVALLGTADHPARIQGPSRLLVSSANQIRLVVQGKTHKGKSCVIQDETKLYVNVVFLLARGDKETVEKLHTTRVEKKTRYPTYHATYQCSVHR